jgi:hypothetical protein
MHTGEPIFGGTDPLDQMCTIVDVLGMPPFEMLKRSPDRVRLQFFEILENISPLGSLQSVQERCSSDCDAQCCVFNTTGDAAFLLKRFGRVTSGSGAERTRDRDTTSHPRTLESILGVHSGGPAGRRRDEQGHSVEKYAEFLNYIQTLLRYDPDHRFSAEELTNHPFNASSNQHSTTVGAASGDAATAVAVANAAAATAAVAAMDGEGVSTGAAVMAAVSLPSPPGAAHAGCKAASTSATSTGAAEGQGQRLDERGRGGDQRSPRLRSLSAPSSASRMAADGNTSNRRYRTRGAAAAEGAVAGNLSGHAGQGGAAVGAQSAASVTTMDVDSGSASAIGGVLESMEVHDATKVGDTGMIATDQDTSMETE